MVTVRRRVLTFVRDILILRVFAFEFILTVFIIRLLTITGSFFPRPASRFLAVRVSPSLILVVTFLAGV